MTKGRGRGRVCIRLELEILKDKAFSFFVFSTCDDCDGSIRFVRLDRNRFDLTPALKRRFAAAEGEEHEDAWKERAIKDGLSVLLSFYNDENNYSFDLHELIVAQNLAHGLGFESALLRLSRELERRESLLVRDLGAACSIRSSSRERGFCKTKPRVNDVSVTELKLEKARSRRLELERVARQLGIDPST